MAETEAYRTYTLAGGIHRVSHNFRLKNQQAGYHRARHSRYALIVASIPRYRASDITAWPIDTSLR